MKTIVIYKSKTGFTKKYAEWIAQELSAEIFAASRVTPAVLKSYETVIYGGGLYAGGINGIKLITRNLDKLQRQRVVVFATGASPAREETIDEVRNKNFSPGQQKKIHFFYLRGGFDYSKLGLFDKLLMQLLKKKLQKKANPTTDERGMLAAFKKPVDFTGKKHIRELVAFIRRHQVP